MNTNIFSPLYGIENELRGEKLIALLKFMISEIIQSGLPIFLLIRVFSG